MSDNRLTSEQEMNEKHPAGAKAHDHFEAASARLKSCPDTSSLSLAASVQTASQPISLAPSAPMTLEQVRAELKGVKGKKYWRSVDELAGTPEFQAAVEKEFPSAAQEWVDPVSRRGFMKLMGASMALAGLAGCTKQPDEPIYPYVKAAGRFDSGQADVLCHGASVCDRRGAAAGQERSVPPHQDRRQPGASVQPWLLGPVYAGERCWICTIRTARSL